MLKVSYTSPFIVLVKATNIKFPKIAIFNNVTHKLIQEKEKLLLTFKI